MDPPRDTVIRPTLSEWMRKAPPRHPIHDVDLATPAAGIAQTLDALERLLDQVARAKPSGLQGKRREFRHLTTEQGLLELRTELAVGAKLYRAGIAFDFETERGSSPDIHLRNRNLAIEVTCRTSDGLPQLLDEIEEELAGVNMAVHLRFSAIPLRMQKHERTALIDKIIQTMASGKGGFDPTPFADSMNPEPVEIGADIFPHTGLGMMHTKMTFEVFGQHPPADWTPLERGILDAASKPAKARQARALPSLVLVDVARWGDAWNRPMEDWASHLATALEPTFPYLAIAVTNAGIHDVDLPLAVALRPELADEDRKRVVDLVEALRPSTDLAVELAAADAN